MGLLRACAETVVLTVFQIMIVLPFVCGEVDIIPDSDLITTTSTNETYRCLPSVSLAGLISVEWLLNGSGSANFTNARSDFIDDIGDGIGRLRLTNIQSEYNSTTIQCVATFRPPRAQAFSSIVTLFVQGTLPAVGSLMASTEERMIRLTWTAPFSLDIPSTDPDITYCVDVVNSTSSATLHSECDLKETEFTYPVPSGSACHDHMIMVTPVNVVGSGEQSSLLFSQTISSPEISQNNRPLPLLQATGVLQYTIAMDAPICFAELTLTEQFSKQVVHFAPSEIDIVGLTNAIVSFTSEGLTVNRHYRGVLNATNVKGSELSDLEISTYDIISAVIGTAPLHIRANYVPNSLAAGGLFVFLFFSGDDSTAVDFSRSAFVFLDQNISREGHVLPFQLPPGQYSVSSYDIEEGGRLETGILFPADTTVHSQRGNIQSSYHPVMSSDIEDCNVTVTNRQVVSALCTHAANSPSSERGFVMIVQRNDININIAVQLLVNETRQGTPMGPVSIQVEENANYHVAIFPRNVESGIVNSALAYSIQVSTMLVVTDEAEPSSQPPSSQPSSSSTSIIIISVSVVLGVLMAATLAGIILVARCRKSASTPRLHEVENTYKEANSQMKEAKSLDDIGVYAEIGDVKSSFSYTQNIVYESSMPTHSDNSTQPLCTSMRSQQQEEFKISPSASFDSHDYEVDRLAQKKTEVKDDSPFLVRQCSAYGTGPVAASDVNHRSSLTQCVAYETTGQASQGRNVTSCDYEQLEQQDTKTSNDPYIVRQCSAYGTGPVAASDINHRSSLTQNAAYEITGQALQGRNDTSDYEQLDSQNIDDPYLVRQCTAYGTALAGQDGHQSLQ